MPASNLIGTSEGRGLQQILSGLELGRINVAARGVGVARACLEESIAYAQTRKTFGAPIAQHQAIQIKLADMATRVEAARLLTEQAAVAYDSGERCDMEAGMAKLFEPKRLLKTPWKLCEFTEHMAIPRNTILSAIIGMRRCWLLVRARMNFTV